jgi:hypothetical protein
MAESKTPTKSLSERFKALFSYSYWFPPKNETQKDTALSDSPPQNQALNSVVNSPENSSEPVSAREKILGNIAEARRANEESLSREQEEVLKRKSEQLNPPKEDKKIGPSDKLRKLVSERLENLTSSTTASQASTEQASPANSRTASPASSGVASPANSRTASPELSRTASPASSGVASPESSRTASPELSRTASPASSGKNLPTRAELLAIEPISAKLPDYLKEMREQRVGEKAVGPTEEPVKDSHQSVIKINRDAINDDRNKTRGPVANSLYFGEIRYPELRKTEESNAKDLEAQKKGDTAQDLMTPKEPEKKTNSTSNWVTEQQKPAKPQPVAPKAIKAPNTAYDPPTPEQQEAKKYELNAEMAESRQRLNAGRALVKEHYENQKAKYEEQTEKAFVKGGEKGGYEEFRKRMNNEKGKSLDYIEASREKAKPLSKTLKDIAKTVGDKLSPPPVYFEGTYEVSQPPHPGSQPGKTSLEGADAGTIRNREEQLKLETKALKGLSKIRMENKTDQRQAQSTAKIKFYSDALTAPRPTSSNIPTGR